jgi:hypothetical protein
VLGPWPEEELAICRGLSSIDLNLITNAVPHNIGTVGVIGSGGAASTVVVFQDELQQGDNGEDDFADGDDEDADAEDIDHTKLSKVPPLCTVLDFTNFHFTSPKTGETT